LESAQYAIASITKTFVARAILILRDEGKLSLDDPLGRHIPEAEREGVTIRRALAHAAGVQREPPGDVWETMEFPDRDQLLAQLGEAEQVLDPAESWHYSNLVYALLGEVVARLADIPAEQFVEERILQPQGLDRTTWGPGENAATGYFVERFADVAVPEPVADKKAIAPAGALWSTVGDLAGWGAFLMEQDEMHTVQVMADQQRWLLGWGLGLMLHRRGERLFAGHDGGAIGHASHLSYARKEKVGIALLTNTENPSMTFDPVSLTEKAAEAMPAEEAPWQPGASVPEELEGALGIWWGEGVDWWFEWRKGSLEARRPGRDTGVRTLFERESEDVYRTVSGRERGELLRIVRDEVGVPVKLYWATYGFTRTAKPLGH
ncbi:MAG: beta-lactamase family protein, partial [Actinobacteria bacterium]|nr:beta-lactamase family protein [Actinomycetota bacterium]